MLACVERRCLVNSSRARRETGFINQRKRHWHKVRRSALKCTLRRVLMPCRASQLFLDGPPSSAEEAHRGLVRAYGSLDAALAAAQRA